MSLRNRLSAFLSGLVVVKSPVTNVDVNVVTDVVVPEFRIDLDALEVPFAERLTTAIVSATASAGVLVLSNADLDKYTDSVYRVTCALIAAQRRNFQSVSEAHWTSLS